MIPTQTTSYFTGLPCMAHHSQLHLPSTCHAPLPDFQPICTLWLPTVPTVTCVPSHAKIAFTFSPCDTPNCRTLPSASFNCFYNSSPPHKHEGQSLQPDRSYSRPTVALQPGDTACILPTPSTMLSYSVDAWIAAHCLFALKELTHLVTINGLERNVPGVGFFFSRKEERRRGESVGCLRLAFLT